MTQVGEEIRRLIDRAMVRLVEGGARAELLVDARRRGRFGGRTRLVESGRAWRLGVLLVARDGSLAATGRTIRADASERMGFTATDARERQEERRAAVRDGFAPGEVLNLDWTPIDPDAPTEPLVDTADGPAVRWSRGADATIPLGRYLDERIDLLLHPPGRE